MTFRYYIQLCEDVFGESFNKPNIQSGVKQTNTNYGGQDIASSKVGYCHQTLSFIEEVFMTLKSSRHQCGLDKNLANQKYKKTSQLRQGTQIFIQKCYARVDMYILVCWRFLSFFFKYISFLCMYCRLFSQMAPSIHGMPWALSQMSRQQSRQSSLKVH